MCGDSASVFFVGDSDCCGQPFFVHGTLRHQSSRHYGCVCVGKCETNTRPAVPCQTRPLSHTVRVPYTIPVPYRTRPCPIPDASPALFPTRPLSLD